jgi:hypothetical protein
MLVLGLATAQSMILEKPLICDETSRVLTLLSGADYKEKPIWWGMEPNAPLARYSLFVNEETKSWTLIQFDEKMACVLGAGGSSTEMFNGPKI